MNKETPKTVKQKPARKVLKKLPAAQSETLTENAISVPQKNYQKVNNKMIFVNTKSSEKKWHLIDAKGQIVGRLAVVIAGLLSGKTKTCFSPNADGGDHVVVINSDEVVFTGNKEIAKNYYHHSGFPGGLKTNNPKTIRMRNNSKYIIRHAVKGMFAHHSPMARKRMLNLYIFQGNEHTHHGQKPSLFPLSPKVRGIRKSAASK